MITKKSDGYYVMSHEGKSLGGPYKTKKEAQNRLAQVENFKKPQSGNNLDGKIDGPPHSEGGVKFKLPTPRGIIFPVTLLAFKPVRFKGPTPAVSFNPNASVTVLPVRLNASSCWTPPLIVIRRLCLLVGVHDKVCVAVAVLLVYTLKSATLVSHFPR